MSKLDKSLKVLWLINGMIILFLTCVACYNVSKDFFRWKDHDDTPYTIVGEELEDAKEKGLALQGLSYSAPQEIYNSNNKYISVSPLTYEEERELAAIKVAAADLDYRYNNTLNIIFLDQHYQVINNLLDRKASIANIKFARRTRFDDVLDTTAKHIAYLIGFEDTNEDGLLNYHDSHNLFISDLNGEGLKQITEGLDVVGFRFKEDNSQLFITYRKRLNIREEYKKDQFALYNINSQKLTYLTSIDSTVIKLEKALFE